jgi:hypothetical protein
VGTLSAVAPDVPNLVTARTVQGMARVRSGQAPPGPWSPGRRGCRGSSAEGQILKIISVKRLEMIFRCPLTVEGHPRTAWELLSRPVDQDRLGCFGLRFLAGPFYELAVDEGRSGADQGDEVGCVYRPPAILR